MFRWNNPFYTSRHPSVPVSPVPPDVAQRMLALWSVAMRRLTRLSQRTPETLVRVFNTRSSGILVLLLAIRNERIRQVLKSAALIFVGSFCLVLNFGWDLRNDRKRKRHIFPGISRLLIVASWLAMWRRRDLRRETWYFYAGCTARLVPLLCFYTCKVINKTARTIATVVDTTEFLPPSAKVNSRYGPQDCAVCLDAGCDYVLDSCHHSFHTKCLETWAKEKSSCPVCKKAFPTRPTLQYKVDLVTRFSWDDWVRHHRVFGSAWWDSPLFQTT